MKVRNVMYVCMCVSVCMNKETEMCIVVYGSDGDVESHGEICDVCVCVSVYV